MRVIGNGKKGQKKRRTKKLGTASSDEVFTWTWVLFSTLHSAVIDFEQLNW